MAAGHFRSWDAVRMWSAELLRRGTGDGLEAWNERIRARGFAGPDALRSWLRERHVNGYAQQLLV